MSTMELKPHIWGKTQADIEDAIDEIRRLIREGCISGSDKNETGGFRFEVVKRGKEK